MTDKQYDKTSTNAIQSETCIQMEEEKLPEIHDSG